MDLYFKHRTIINEKKYDVCDCEAFDINVTDTSKYCSVKDLEGNILLLQKINEAPVPMRVKFIGYFPNKEYGARILRVNYLHDGTEFYVFPNFYLSGHKQ